ncbi:Uncharacterized protein DAT39_008943 [Clarias magur]|uniref:Uncharacterized protein n=1 Tax=Clarias magur TaxID=1594786 RepID=A0A8J4X251_CLAMG|nr:Uncharacterized protein DAT39_008943 [Clarias magur]
MNPTGLDLLSEFLAKAKHHTYSPDSGRRDTTSKEDGKKIRSKNREGGTGREDSFSRSVGSSGMLSLKP